ncbi:class I SAM-dependent methyltransferase [Thermococcus sp. 18S1]|uniref:class I SAM-dependent methyltransferase n=1 Tax=Thermococcus sp. 18S1 TaxID=1638210 RepID=UPI00143960E7|nr:class I SAM-dependent methyltransferase [Thermococcus sp. 18S1]NJE30670.1 class I SAM-dependent methyltransferase [Thermococcus sp. 18S1]
MKIEGIPGPGAHIYTIMARGRRNLDRIIAKEIASNVQRGRILDVGTGPGFIPIEIAKMNPDLEVVGIDISPTMVKLARKNAREAGVENVRFDVMSAYELKFPEEHFDMLISFGALHHFTNLLGVFNEAYRVLKPGGEAWIYDMVRDVPIKDLKEFLRKTGLPKFPWLIGFKLHGLKREQWLGEVSKFVEQSRFEEYRLEDNTVYMKLVLRKSGQ